MRPISWDVFSEYLCTDEEILREVIVSWEQFCRSVSGYLSNTIEALFDAVDQAVAMRDEQLAWTYIERFEKELTGLHVFENYPSCKELFPLVWITAVLPTTLRTASVMNISDSVVRETLADFSRWVHVYRTQHEGKIGFRKGRWFLHHLCWNLVQLGNLQYQLTVHEHPFELYRNVSSGEWICMAIDDLLVDETGHIAGTNGFRGSFWRTWRRDGADTVSGFPVDMREGVVLSDPITLHKADLLMQAATGWSIVNIHIPAGVPFSEQDVSDSIFTSRQLLPKLGFPTNVYECDSWLLDPSLESCAPKSSNICSFMRRFDKFPVKREIPQLYERLFGHGFTLDALHHWPCVTSLQCSVRDYLLSGNQVYTTAGVLRDDFSRSSEALK